MRQVQPVERKEKNLKQTDMLKPTGINFINSKENRNAPTEAEAVLWDSLRGRKFLNLKFRRQHSVRNYILDFFCYELNLAVEVDGKYHSTEKQTKYNQERTSYLNLLGIKVLRITNEDATNPDISLKKLKTFIESNQAPSPRPTGSSRRAVGEGGG